MLTHNAPDYVKLTISSLKKHTKNVDYELIVLDNGSGLRTRSLLKSLYRKKKIDKLIMSTYNTLFAAGNNMMSHAVRADSELYLLLNSDIEIKNDNWLSNLVKIHKGGVTTYGVVDSEPFRVDGFCYLIDAELYHKFPLDAKKFQWFWAITKQQAQILTSGYEVQGYKDHEKYLHHFGGKSGGDFKGAAGMDTPIDVSKDWFKNKKPTFL